MQAYLIQNRLNGKGYIGITTRSIGRRWYEHRFVPNSCGKLLSKAIQKYNADLFEITVLASALADVDSLKELEKQLIVQHKTLVPSGYNLTMGGDGVFGYKHSEEQKKRNGDLKRGVKHSEETKQKMKIAHLGENNHFYGKNHTEEAKRKNSEKHIGKQSMLGKTHSVETKEKIKKSRLGVSSKLGNRQGIIIATNILTGNEIILNGAKEMTNNNFSTGHVYKCVMGKRKSHHGYVFKRIAL
jgi:group I intron endonuclease